MRSKLRMGCVVLAAALTVGSAQESKSSSVAYEFNSKMSRPKVFVDEQDYQRGIGTLSYKNSWQKHGAYIIRLQQSVQNAWARDLAAGKFVLEPNKVVEVKFVLNAEGVITQILSIRGSTVDPRCWRACVAALAAGMPYPEWTPTMRADLGPEQVLSQMFYF